MQLVLSAKASSEGFAIRAIVSLKLNSKVILSERTSETFEDAQELAAFFGAPRERRSGSCHVI